jgi:pimeloyl-ACP methyl ester carboxylesterase
VGAVADGLGIERFSALGVSGGGPYALACGRLYPERIDAVGLVSSVGSEEEPGVLLRSSRLLVALGRMSPRFAAAAIAVARRCPARRPEGVLKALEAEFAHDGVDAPEAARLLLADLLEAFSSGGRGVAADCARVRRWGFDPEEVRVPVYLWHGREDTNVSVAAARRLAARLPSCRARFLPGEGHFGVLPRHGREIVKTLVAVASGCFRCTQIAALMSSS